jgi:hypothetical protein
VAHALPENEKSAVVAVSSAGVLAWGLYSVLIVLGHPAAAVCVGIVVMLALVMREYRHGSVNIVDCTSLSFFVLALLSIVTTGHGLFSIYRTIAAWGIFAVVAWATLIAGFPFTLQYARERAPREIWNAAAASVARIVSSVKMMAHTNVIITFIVRNAITPSKISNPVGVFYGLFPVMGLRPSPGLPPVFAISTSLSAISCAG